MNLRSLTFAFAATSILATSALAWPPTYGSEFNFGSPEMHAAWLERGRLANYQGSQWQVPAEAERDAAKKFSETVKAHCGSDCTVTPHSGKFGSTEYTVRFSDGYNFNISVDPDCVEIQTDHESLAQVEQFESREQEFIYGVVNELGMTTAGQTAHFNIGLLSAFEGQPKAFLKYFIRYHNLPQLSTGVLGKDPANAPPISHLTEEQKQALSRIVDDVNAGNITRTQDVAVRIQNEVYTSTPTFDVGYHYQGISVKYVRSYTTMSTDRPFEFRAPRQPKTAHERTLLAELSEQRMAFERADEGPIVFLDVPKQLSYSDAELANSFRFYLAEMGADWDHFKPLLPPELQNQPADAFMSGKVKWSRSADVENVKFYTRYAASSPLARDRLKTMLTSPEAIASGKVDEILEAAGSSLGVQANHEGRLILDDFIAAVRNPASVSAPAVAVPIPAAKGKFRAYCDRLLARFGF